MLDLKIKKNQVGVLLALLAVVFVAAAVYVYRSQMVSEGFDNESDEDEDDDVGEEGFASFASV